MLIPSSVITVPNWKESLQPFLALYVDKVPSPRTLDAELLLMVERQMELQIERP